MKNNETALKRKARRSSISRRLLLQYFFSLAGFVVGLIVFIYLAAWFCRMFVWYGTEPLYRLLNFIKNYLWFFGGGAVLAGWAVLTYFFISRPLGYLDEVVDAAGQLATPGAQPVVLSPVLHETENELNLVRERAQNDARTAKEAEQRKNDLIVYLAHDLKTPLTSVIGYLTLLKDEPQISPELTDKYTAIALKKAERLEELLNEFFEITRFNLMSLSLEEETVNLTRMLEQVVSEFGPVFAEKNLTAQTELAADVRVSCDTDKLGRVFDNLFHNAVYYSYPSTEVTTVLTQRDDTAVIKVTNHGKTIPPEKLDQIFERFFRLDSARASATGGAGLGLAIAKEITELHGGTIVAESADETVTFTVTLPLSRHKNV